MRPLLLVFAVLRRYSRTPIQYKLGDLASDRRDIERRYLVAELGRRLANQLMYYPPDVGQEALRAAEWLLTGSVRSLPAALGENEGLGSTAGGAEILTGRGHILRVWWALVAFGACLAGLGYVVQGRG